MQPLISVIIPIYRVEDYMDKCIKSITEQTYNNLEIYLVVGDAGDQCLAKSYEWEKKDPRITVIERPCNGLSDARNAGLDVMTGEYVAFIDSDDFVDTSYIMSLYQAIQETGADSAICGVQVIDEKDKLLETLPATESSHVENYSGREIVKKELQGKWQYVTAWGTLFPASLYEKLRYPFKKTHEDEFTFHLLYDGQASVACVPQNMYIYLQRSDSLMGVGYSKKDCMDFMDMWHKRIAFYEERQRRELLPSVIQSFLAWAVLYVAMHDLEMEKREKVLIKKDIKKYFWRIFERPYLFNLGYSVKLAIKCFMTLCGSKSLRKRYMK
jgi:glycosyltransferase involved in cell wall biosynthesis